MLPPTFALYSTYNLHEFLIFIFLKSSSLTGLRSLPRKGPLLFLFIAGYQRKKCLFSFQLLRLKALGHLSPSHATSIGCKFCWLSLQNISRFSLLSHFPCDLSWSEPPFSLTRISLYWSTSFVLFPIAFSQYWLECSG